MQRVGAHFSRGEVAIVVRKDGDGGPVRKYAGTCKLSWGIELQHRHILMMREGKKAACSAKAGKKNEAGEAEEERG